MSKMLRFELEMSSPAVGEVSGLARGHMAISGNRGTVTSKGASPDQSMMIFVSVVELLDGLRRFSISRNTSSYDFVATDSSFQFSATKMDGDRIRLTAQRRPIDEVPMHELVQAVWHGVQAFLSQHGASLRSDDAVAGDLQSAVEAFGETFRLGEGRAR